MDPIQLLLYVLALVAAALSWAVASGRPLHRPVAWLLTFQIISDLTRLAIRELVFLKHGPWPATGWLRAVFHVEQALFIGWRMGIAALAVRIFGGRRPWPVFLAFAVIELGLAASYPAVRGELLQRAYLAIELAVLCVSIGFALQWLSRREPWTPETLVTGLIIALEAAMVTGGPYRFVIFSAWDRAWAILLVMYAGLIIVEGWVWSKSTRS